MAIKLKTVMTYAREKRFRGIHLEANGDLRVSYPVFDHVTHDVNLIISPQAENRCSPQAIYDRHGRARQIYTDPRHAVDDTLRMLNTAQMPEGF